MVRRLSPEYFRRYDDSPDELFYNEPRKVVHIDEQAIVAAGTLYGELLPPGGFILDLMSSWRTHLPEDYKPSRVTGLGMNAEEMQENPQLNDYVLHNLNRDPRLPFPDRIFTGAICTVSVQYLTRPIEVCNDLRRVLKPGSPAIFTFSNRCFPSKAVLIWQMTSMEQKSGLVTEYMRAAGFERIQMQDRSVLAAGGKSPVEGQGDPLIGVWGYRPADEEG